MQVTTKVSERSAAAASGSPVTILAFAGDISSASKDAILAAYHGIDGGCSKILLDFTGVDYINSSGIAIVIQMLLRFQTADFILFGPGTPETAVKSGSAALRMLAPRAVTIALPEDLRTVDAHEAAQALLGLFQTASPA